MDELFENTLSPLPALEQARRDLVEADAECERARVEGTDYDYTLAAAKRIKIRAEVARLERERFGH